MNQARSPALYQKTLFFILSLTVLGYLLYHTLAGGDLLTPNVYDNYALQAQSWLNGCLDVKNGASYTWLELAIFQGSYYVSFPPVPTLVVLPFVALFGMSPSNLLIALYAIAACIAVFQCCRTVGLSPAVCGFWALFFYLCHQFNRTLPYRRCMESGTGSQSGSVLLGIVVFAFPETHPLPSVVRAGGGMPSIFGCLPRCRLLLFCLAGPKGIFPDAAPPFAGNPVCLCHRRCHDAVQSGTVWKPTGIWSQLSA